MDTQRYVYKVPAVFICCLMTFYVTPVCSFNVTEASALHTYILNSYNRYVKPADPVDVELDFHLLTINQLDVRTQKLSTSGWFTLTWIDQRFNWSSTSYVNMPDAYFHEDNIWLPQIVVDNTFNQISAMAGSNLLVRVTPEGLVTWEPPGLYNTHCAVDTTWFPFDVQTCILSISGWPYNTDDINLTHKFPYITTNDYQLNGEWLLSSTYVLSVVEDGQRRLNFVMQLERLSAFYTMNVIVPILMTSLLTPMVFKLPSESGERVSFILTVVLALEVLLTVVSANMPATSLHTSVMEVYLVVVLSISALAVLLTSLVLKLYHRGDDTDLPKAIRIVLHSRKHLRRQQLVKSTNEETGLDMDKMKTRECHENEDVSSQGIQKLKNNYVSEEFDGLETMKSRGKITCQELSIRLDEILFWVFLCLTVVSTFIFMLTMALGGP